MSPTRILCVEDDREIADLIAEVLAEEGFAVERAATGPEGLARLRARPDAVICDIDLPGFSGLDLLRRAGEAGAPPPFIFLTAFGGRRNQIEARRLGCADFVTKPIDFELLVAVLRNVLQRAPVRRTVQEPAVQMTEREREILTLVSRGKSSVEIAQILAISERTTNFHIGNVMKKLNVTSRVQAAVIALSMGLLEK